MVTHTHTQGKEPSIKEKYQKVDKVIKKAEKIFNTLKKLRWMKFCIKLRREKNRIRRTFWWMGNKHWSILIMSWNRFQTRSRFYVPWECVDCCQRIIVSRQPTLSIWSCKHRLQSWSHFGLKKKYFKNVIIIIWQPCVT